MVSSVVVLVQILFEGWKMRWLRQRVGIKMGCSTRLMAGLVACKWDRVGLVGAGCQD
jgi:hypothetical protein